MRKLLLIGFVFCLGVAVVLGAGLAGYFTHREQIAPAYGLMERVIAKVRRELGIVEEATTALGQVETIFLDLEGSSYRLPGYDFKSGGALASWNGDVLVMHRSGRIYYLDDGEGLVLSDITVPDNGLTAYEALAAEKYPGRRTRADAIRYNDLEFVESPAFRGLLLSYTYIDTEAECYSTRVSKLPVPLDSPAHSIREISATAADWELVIDTRPCLPFNASGELILGYMAGGRMAFRAPSTLYLGNGDYHLDGIYRPDVGIQDDTVDYGKVLEIDVVSGEYRHFSKGHRNMQGVTLDLEGRLWTTEHMMRGGDELNLVRDGGNYGWPLENLGTMYSKVPAATEGEVGRHTIHDGPMYAWLPSAAVSSLAVVDGFHPTWDGDLLIGSLRGRTLFRARIQDDRLQFLEEIPIGQRIRDVMQVRPDTIALWLDSGELVMLTPKEIIDPLEGMTEGLIAAGVPAEGAESARQIIDGCRECHSLEADVHGAGPSLHGIVGRPVASTPFENYSDELRAHGGAWSADRLAAFLAAPDEVVPGTTMTGLGVGDAETAGFVVRGFEWLAGPGSAAAVARDHGG